MSVTLHIRIPTGMGPSESTEDLAMVTWFHVYKIFKSRVLIGIALSSFFFHSDFPPLLGGLAVAVDIVG